MEKVKLPRATNASFVKLPTLTSVPLIKKSNDLVSFVFNLAQLSFEISLPDDARPKYRELIVPQSADISVAVNRNTDLIPLLVTSCYTKPHWEPAIPRLSATGHSEYNQGHRVQSVILSTTSHSGCNQLHWDQPASTCAWKVVKK